MPRIPLDTRRGAKIRARIFATAHPEISIPAHANVEVNADQTIAWVEARVEVRLDQPVPERRCGRCGHWESLHAAFAAGPGLACLHHDANGHCFCSGWR